MNTQTQVVEPGTDETPHAAGEIEVRRRGAVSGAVGVAGCLVAVAWFLRATTTGTLADWVVCAVVAALGVVHLLSLLDARTPLLVADEHGVRVRRGKEWEGVTWRQVDRVEHRPRRGVLRDGSLLLTREATPGAEGAAEPLRLSLTVTTRVVGAVDLTDALSELAGADTEVVEIEPQADEVETEPEETEAREGSDGEAGPTSGSERGLLASSTPLPVRDLRESTRADVVLGAAALRLDPAESDDDTSHAGAGGPRLPEARELRRDGSVNLVEETSTWGSRVTPISRPGDPVIPLVIDDHAAPAPAIDPVIGPELVAARTRLGLSVDQLAERTRIRPHVIESIEVDDFEPCGGDFYARGHLRTLARVLGIDVAPLLSAYDAQYADAPIDPRRVFEAELATGQGGSIRGTRGGPNWSVLVAAVMTVVLVWSVARLVMENPSDLTPPSPRLNSSGGLDNGVPAQGAAVPVVLTAAGGGSQVIVRSGSEVVFDDQLAFMQTVQLDVAPPIRVGSSDGGLLVTVDGVEEGPLGETGQEAQDIFVP